MTDEETVPHSIAKAAGESMREMENAVEEMSKDIGRASEQLRMVNVIGRRVDHPRYGEGEVTNIYWSEELEEWRIIYKPEGSESTVEVPHGHPLEIKEPVYTFGEEEVNEIIKENFSDDDT